MASSGEVFITINDGSGSVAQVPAASVQLVLGCAVAGTNYQIVATQSPQVLASNFTAGPLVEAAALACLGGGTVLAMRVPLTTKGSASAVVHTGTGASVMTVTLDSTNGAFDDYDVKVVTVTGGTIGTAGVVIKVSLDAGRNFGANIALGTATTYAVSNTGITLNFTVASMVAADTFTFGTTGPKWQNSDIQTALNTFAASQYGVIGVGSTHIVGNGNNSASLTGGVPGADCATIQGYLDTLATGFTFTRSFISARDASPPSAFGGTGESESTWINAINADFSTVNAKRLCVGAANWNMPSAFTNASAGSPRLRRNIAFAAAARQVAVPPQRHLGRVRDGSLTQIVIDPANDPLDGFVYHDESQTAGLDYKFSGTGGRFMTTLTRKGAPGVFITNPLLMAPLNSDFWMLPFGSVMDVACDIVNQVGSQFINEDIRLNANGTIFENDAKFLEVTIKNAIDSNMLSAGMISPGTVVQVDRTNNVKTTSNVNVTVTIVGKGYVEKITLGIGFSNPNAAQ
jgi:hypothetical protein